MNIIEKTRKTFAPLLLIAVSASATAADLPLARRLPDFNLRCAAIAHAGNPFVRGINCRWVAVDGYPREYIVYVPNSCAYAPRRESPVVFFFHGAGGRAEHVLRTSGWREKAEEQGFIVVFGTGLPYRELSSGEIHTHWNRMNLAATVDLAVKPPGYPDAAPWPADDVAFTDVMLADVQAGLRIDGGRIYVAGFSNGGGMAMRLAIERSEVFAAAAAAGAGGLGAVYDPPRKMPLCYAIGTSDAFLLHSVNNAPDAPVPPLTALPLAYDQAFAFSVVQERFENITATFGVSSEPERVWESENELRIRYLPAERTEAGDQSQVLVSIQGGIAHEYPVGDDNPAGFDDTALFWRFFRAHPLE